MTSDDILAAVEAVMSRPFEWGVADCCTAACDVFQLLHGIDPMSAMRAQYVGLRGAAALIQANGGLPALADAMAAQGGFAEGHRLGGLALSHDGKTLLICIADGQWAGKSADGFAIVNRAGRGWYHA